MGSERQRWRPSEGQGLVSGLCSTACVPTTTPWGGAAGAAAPLSSGAPRRGPAPSRTGARPPETLFNWGCQAAERAEGREGTSVGRPGGREAGARASSSAGV